MVKWVLIFCYRWQLKSSDASFAVGFQFGFDEFILISPCHHMLAVFRRDIWQMSRHLLWCMYSLSCRLLNRSWCRAACTRLYKLTQSDTDLAEEEDDVEKIIMWNNYQLLYWKLGGRWRKRVLEQYLPCRYYFAGHLKDNLLCPGWHVL